MTEKNLSNAPLVLLAAGGTGGHVFPALSLAKELQAAGFNTAFVTDKRGKSFNNHDDIVVYRLPVSSPRGGLTGVAKGALSIGVGYFHARKLLRTLKPAAIVGFGGYCSLPAVLAAAHQHVPILLHEANSVLGRANRLLARYAETVAVGFPDLHNPPSSSKIAVVNTGNPVRDAISALYQQSYTPPAPEGELKLLVTGGSQGAKIFSDIVPEACSLLPPAMRTRIKLTQQCRPEDIERVRRRYLELSMTVDISPFFEDMDKKLANAHLVICRSGASTIAELAIAGLPALLVPYPYATDDHQLFNAEMVAAKGAAWMISQRALTPECLAARLESALRDPLLLQPMHVAARNMAKPDSSRTLSALVQTTINQHQKNTNPTGAIAA
ncbi:MAG: undecaprenyldiphospho-muramoylpentapeptide beta-N-acetylglucosaminyltransferase [Alphaproteobacteria bacterium]